MPKLKGEEAGSFSKPERRKLQGLYKYGNAAYWFVRNSLRASFLSVSKNSQFLFSKPSYRKYNLIRRELKRINAFAKIKKEIWFVNLAYVELNKDYNCVNSLLTHQELFDRTIDAKGMKTKGSKDAVGAFSIMNNKELTPTNLSRQRNGILGKIPKTKTERMQTYFTMSETKAAFAEPTIRSLKSILYRSMKDYGCKCIHKSAQFVTSLTCTGNCSIDLIPKNVKKADILSILFSKQLRKFRKRNFKNGDSVHISKYD